MRFFFSSSVAAGERILMITCYRPGLTNHFSFHWWVRDGLGESSSKRIENQKGNESEASNNKKNHFRFDFLSSISLLRSSLFHRIFYARALKNNYKRHAREKNILPVTHRHSLSYSSCPLLQLVKGINSGQDMKGKLGVM